KGGPRIAGSLSIHIEPVASSYGSTKSSRSGKLPVNGGWAAHNSVQLEAAMGSAGTGRAPVTAGPVLRISMLLLPGTEVAREERQAGPGSGVGAKLIQWRAIRRARRALAGGISVELVADRVLKT